MSDLVNHLMNVPNHLIYIPGKDYLLRPLGDLKALAPGETAHLIGTLTGVKASTVHGDTVTVNAKGTYSGKETSAKDPWFAKNPAPALAKTGANAVGATLTAAATMIGAGLVLLAARRRKIS